VVDLTEYHAEHVFYRLSRVGSVSVRNRLYVALEGTAATRVLGARIAKPSMPIFHILLRPAKACLLRHTFTHCPRVSNTVYLVSVSVEY